MQKVTGHEKNSKNWLLLLHTQCSRTATVWFLQSYEIISYIVATLQSKTRVYAKLYNTTWKWNYP